MDPTGRSYTVRARDAMGARTAARLLSMEAGRAPYAVLYVEDLGDGTFEVVLEERPLGPHERLTPDGRRLSSRAGRA